MKGRIGKNFKAEGRTALEAESNKGHHQWCTQGFGKGGEGDTTGGLGVKPPASVETKGVWGHSPQPPTIFYNFHIKNAHFSTLFLSKKGMQ